MDSPNRNHPSSQPPLAPADDHRFVSSLTASYVVALIVLAVLSIGAFLIIARVVDTESRFSARLVENGRQLSEVLQASQAAHDLVHSDSAAERGSYRSELSALLDSIENRHAALISGDEALGLPPLQ